MLLYTSRYGITKLQAIIIAVIVIVGAIVGIFTYQFMTPKEKAEEILIGAAVSQTGVYAATGSKVLRGYQLWAKLVNEKGGILGRTVRLITYDDKSDPSLTKTLYERLITVDKVDLILGPYSSACALTMIPVAEQYGMVTIQPTNNARKLYASGYEYQFLAPCSEGLADLHNFEPVIKLLASLPQDIRPKTVALVNTADVYPQSVADGIPPLCEKYGFQLVFSDKIEKGTTDVSGVVTRVKNLNPDVFIAVGYVPEETLVVKTCKELGFNPKAMVIAVGMQSAPLDTIKTLGETANYVMGPAFYDPRLPFASNKEFVEAYRAEYGEDPQFVDAGGYAACQLLEAAIAGTGTYKDQNAIKEYLLTHKISTVFGIWEVDNDLALQGIKYIPKTTVYAAQILNGKVELVYPPGIATANFVYPKPPW